MTATGSIIIVRHGRTAFNATGRLQGRADNPLDEVGVLQAERVAHHLAPELDADSLIVCSPLIRARATAERIAQLCGADVVIDERWIELDYGSYEGRPQSDIPAEVWKQWRGDNNFAAPNGESLNQVHARVTAACEDLAVQLSGRIAVVVTHVSPIKSAMAWALGVDVGVGWKSHLDTASITRIGVTPRGPVLRSFNETARESTA